MADRFENLYDRIVNEEDARVCKEISDGLIGAWVSYRLQGEQ